MFSLLFKHLKQMGFRFNYLHCSFDTLARDIYICSFHYSKEVLIFAIGGFSEGCDRNEQSSDAE